MNEYKIAVVGGGSVGKTALTHRFIELYRNEEYDPTIEETYRKEKVIDEETIKFEILDYARQEEYSQMRDSFMKEGVGFIIVYAINSRSSFDQVSSFREQILMINDADDFPMIIVGNKTDLENAREVSQEEAMNFATTINCPFIESSAKNFTNVEQPFCDLVREIKNVDLKHCLNKNDLMKQRHRKNQKRCTIL
ncbi:ras-like protein [Anaeramoeba flamelloides]|uniref:Ras-like protein n=1 Tax=Anaeramoeba flamelloides TaxID=1746091 RepID=A0AAV7ZPD0_9EUKA|nr:ras-like protein [Anaeramoeba flamelloides]